MEDITQKLKKLTKSRSIPKLIYKQSNERRANLFINDVSVN